MRGTLDTFGVVEILQMIGKTRSSGTLHIECPQRLLDVHFVRGRIAGQLGMARTGGSDAHRVEHLMRCYTQVPDPVTSTADLVAALKDRSTVPHRPEPQRKRRLGIFKKEAR